MARTLYICYFGVRQPLVQTQVIPYLLEIAKDGIGVSLLTFEPDLKKKWTPEQIKAMADKIMTRAVRTHTMPQGNKTGMTDEERTILKRWFLQGAKID